MSSFSRVLKMQTILHFDHSLEQDRDVLVQHPPRVRWLDEKQADSTVELLQRQPTMADWVEWVERSGGKWANQEDLRQL
jgi:hypothetical protein